jgi:hypothetical protein
MSVDTNDPTSQTPPKPGMVLVFCRYITRNGKRIYPKSGKCFAIWVMPKKAA